MGAFKDLAAQFDQTDVKRKGDQFEIVCKWFLENDTGQYKQLLRRVWLWKDWPRRWGIDAGIDLVAEDNEGRLWAIQAKAYTNTVTRDEVNKFLAEASRGTFAHRMLMATTDKLSPTAQRTMEDLGVTFIGLTELEDFTQWPAKLTALHPVKTSNPLKPHDYQQDAIRDVVSGFKTAERGQLIMACGTGKTLTAWFIKEKMAAERTLVLVPSLSLLKQTMKSWRGANPKRHFDALPVCSDETVADDEDAAISHKSYLGEPATTDPKVIGAFLRKRSGPRVVFATYQSSPQIAAAFKLGRVPQFDLVIADEAHRVSGPVSSDFGTVLDPKEIKAKRRLFMTATPRIFAGRVLAEAIEADDEIASMDDHPKFGEVFHRLGFSEAIRRNLLTDYQVAIIGVDDATYREWAERARLLTLNGRKTDARSLAGQIGLAKAMGKFDLHRVISFHSRVKTAKEFAASMPEVLAWMPAQQRPKGRLWSKYASGAMSAGERHVLLQHLKRLDDGERGLLANARCLSEGVDVPALDGVAFIDPRRSEVDIVQAVGRAIRKSTTKTVGTIVIPVFVDTDQDAEVALDSSAFKPVWDVIKALRAHDTELGEQLDTLRRELGRRRGKLRLPDKIHVDVPTKVGSDFADALDIRLVERTTGSWEFWIGLLEGFVAEKNTALVPQGCIIHGHNLGSWVNSQRTLYERGALSDERVAQLDAIAGWSWHPHVDRWETQFTCLLRYAEEHGDVSGIRRSTVVDGSELGKWVEKQRTKRNSGSLATDRAARLEQLPGWSWDPFTERWEAAFHHLLDYVALHGTARKIGQKTTINGFKLGTWVNAQRTKRANRGLDPQRENRLSDVPGWTWNQVADLWPDAINDLRDYVRRNGNALVPRSYVAQDGCRLGDWVHNRRVDYNRGVLDSNRQKELEGQPGWSWDPKSEEWERNFARLTRYIQSGGSVRALTGDPALQRWVNRQRASRVAGKLDADRARRLQALPGWLWSTADQWNDAFELLEKYVANGGNGAVPLRTVFDGYQLGMWVRRQRALYSRNALNHERVSRLERIHGWTWDPNTDMWENSFRQLLAYVQTHGSAHVRRSYVTDDGFRLGAWAGKQRDSRRAGSLKADREARLEALPGWKWDSR